MSLKTNQLLPFLIATIFLLAFSAVAQQPDQQPDALRAPFDDPIRELNLTPEQRAQIRAIRQQNQEERATTNRRLREANQALELALDEDTPDEAIVEQRVRDVAMLQASQMRLRVLSEVRIRRVLTAEQRALLRQFRLARRLRREPKYVNPRREGFNRRFPNQRNGLNPATPPSRP